MVYAKMRIIIFSLRVEDHFADNYLMNIAGVGLTNDWVGKSGGKSQDVNSEMNLLVMKKAQNAAEEQGQALVEMVNQASNVINSNGRIDLYA